ncbi:MAG: hypothetical protein H6742_03990 [Alphaproteobacteria bacterium]|nr:hypothetical protein [Alphaproteobacteria bacterium]
MTRAPFLHRIARDLRDAAGAALLSGGVFGLPIGLAAASALQPALDLELHAAPAIERPAVFVLADAGLADDGIEEAASPEPVAAPSTPDVPEATEPSLADASAAAAAASPTEDATAAGPGGEGEAGADAAQAARDRYARRRAPVPDNDGAQARIAEFGPRGGRQGSPVVLVRHGQEMRQYLSTGEAPPVQQRKRGRKCADASGAIEDRGDGLFEVERELVDMYVNDLKLAAELASVAWHDDAEGKRDGFRIRRIRCGTVLHEAGFRNGDVVHAVNGKKIRTVLGAIGAYRKLKRKDFLRVDITRQSGETIRLRYQIS